MIETALGWMAIIWVVISWAKIVAPKKYHKYLCLKCATFYITLIITFDPITAAVAALLAMLVDTYQNNIKITL